MQGMGSINHSCNWETKRLALGIKDARVNHTATCLWSAGRRNSITTATHLYLINCFQLCYLTVCQPSSQFGSISSPAYTTTRSLKPEPGGEDCKLLTLNHHTSYVTREGGTFWHQHIPRAFRLSCSPEKPKSAFAAPTTLNLQGEKNKKNKGKKIKTLCTLCTESSLGKSCNSNYRYCLPKPSAVAFPTPGRVTWCSSGGGEERETSQQPKPGCKERLRCWHDPKPARSPHQHCHSRGKSSKRH